MQPGITQNTQQLAPAALKKVEQSAGVAKRPSTQQAAHGGRPAAGAPPASDALSILQSAISAIETHFAKAEALGKPVDLLGNDQKNKA